MREIRQSGSEGGVGREPYPYPYKTRVRFFEILLLPTYAKLQ